jgi:hypothetical protein
MFKNIFFLMFFVIPFICISQETNPDSEKSCTTPTGLFAQNEKINGADLYWSVNNDAVSWDIEFGDYGFTPTGVPTYEGVSMPFTVTGLKQRSYYQFYVRANCGENVYSNWSSPATVHTSDARTYLLHPTNNEVNIPLNDTLKWKKIDKATKYLLTLGTSLHGDDILNEFPVYDTIYISPDGLRPSIYYFWEIKTVYNGTNDTAFRVSNMGNKFETVCQPLTPPYYQDFNGIYLPACWKEHQAVLTSGFSKFDSDNSYWTSGNFGNNPENSQSSFLFLVLIENEGKIGQWLVSPSIDLSTKNNYQLEFDMALTKRGLTDAVNLKEGDTLAVVISTDNGQTWSKDNIIKLWTYTSNISNTGEHVIIDLSNYNSVIKIGFYGRGFENYDLGDPALDWFIDNFSINLNEDCHKPLFLNVGNITSTSAELSWTEIGNATQWDIELGKKGFVPTGTPTKTVNTDPYNYLELTQNTYYDFYVRSRCSETSFSSWTGPKTFLTSCDVEELNYTENFDNTPVSDQLPQCMSQNDENSDGIVWHLIGFGNSQPNSVVIKKNSNNRSKDDWLFSAALNLEANKTYQLNFYYKCNQFYKSSEKLSAHWSNEKEVSSMLANTIFTNENITNTDWTSATTEFSPKNPGTYYIGFHAYSLGGADGDLFIDDIKVIKEIPKTEWTGNVDTDWNNPANWTNGVPNSNSEVVIPYNITNYPVLSGNISFYRLTFKEIKKGGDDDK